MNSTETSRLLRGSHVDASGTRQQSPENREEREPSELGRRRASQASERASSAALFDYREAIGVTPLPGHPPLAMK